jgi:flagellar biosynthesis anti-sigma factor FlgM
LDINPLNRNLAAGAYGARRSNRSGDTPGSAGASDASQTGGANAAGDGIQLSDQAQTLSRANAAVRGAPDVRQGLVDQLKDSIQSGQYQIDDEAIARRLLEGEG